MSARYGTSDGTTWPVIVTDEDRDGIEWRLRYASPLDLSKEDRLFLASVVAAYRSLTDPRTVAPRDKFARARRAVRAAAAPPETKP